MWRDVVDLRPRRLLLAAAVALVQVGGTLGMSARLRASPVSASSGSDTGWNGGWNGSGWTQWQAGRTGVDALAVLLLLVASAALLLRRRPVLAACGAVGATAVYVAAGYVLGPVLLAPAVALVLAVGAGSRLPAWAVAAAGWVLAVAGSQLGPRPLSWTAGLGAVVWVVAILAVADVVLGRRQRRVAEARAEGEQRRRRVTEERLQIARDLHDGVAHQISLISVRAGVALHLLDTGDESAPAEAREALGTIRQASSEALAELRSALGALRADGEDAPRHPVPGLVAGAGPLVERWRRAGLTVTVDGVPGALPAAVDQAAYRVVQEALTNVSRHSAATTVGVRWEAGADGSTATLTVTDPGPRRPPAEGAREDTREGGSGLLGMHERVALLGGSLAAGPRGDGWQVRAVLPLPAGSPPPSPSPPSASSPATGFRS